MKIGYYPGCTLKVKAKNLEDSAVQSLKALDVELVELERWNCCGAVHNLADDDLVHFLAPVRDLMRAKEQGFDTVATLCSMCYNTLARANLLMRNDEVKREALNDFMDEECNYAGEVEIVHLLTHLGRGHLEEGFLHLVLLRSQGLDMVSLGHEVTVQLLDGYFCLSQLLLGFH